MTERRSGPLARARGALAWTLLFFAAGQAGLGALVTRVHPEVRDPEYGTLLGGMRTRLARSPGRPLVLVLGSSRPANAVRPSVLPDGPGEPLVFNFSLVASGPLRELQAWRRLRAAGIRPAWVLLEAWPPFLTQRGDYYERPYILGQDLQWPDWPVVRHYLGSRPGAGKLLEGLLVPGFAHRAGLLARYAPSLTADRPEEGTWHDFRPRTPEDGGWMPTPRKPHEPLTPELFLLHTAINRVATLPVLGDFRVDPASDRALRELLGDCARDGVRVALVVYPEHSGWRACYPPPTRARVYAYLSGLAAEFEAAAVDTRCWLPDGDFADPMHVLPRAAGPFTERLGREVIKPLVEGRPLPAGALLREDPEGEGPSPPKQDAVAH
jgi:hypothetical protein